MKITLYQKLAATLVGVFIVLLSLFFIWSQQLSQASKAEGEQRLHLALAEHLAHDNPLLAKGVYDYAGLENLFHTLMLLGPSFEFYYLNPEGEIQTYSAKPGKVKRQKVDLTPLTTLMAGKAELPIYGDDPRNINKQKIFSVAPVMDANQQLQGYLYVIIGGEIHDNIFAQIKANESLKQSASIVVMSLIFLLLVVLGLLKYFTKPLSRLSLDMQQIDATHPDFNSEQLSHWQKGSYNEIHQLGEGFNQMALQIHQQFGQLQSLDQQRRELLADLSHDLRTPLASLQGYIETISLQDEQLTLAQRAKFIEISLKNARDLRKLIDQIFELAYLEGGQVEVNKETFALAELIYDIKAKFALKAEQKNITLAISPEEFNGQVTTDLAKLERILSNLIDNAIRHTPEKGRIDIELLPVGEAAQGLYQKVQVIIKDTGVGISEQEIDYIFDTRYRASNSQGKKGQNAGLGLAITKKLVNLLNSDISVQSELGKGTQFSFYL